MIDYISGTHKLSKNAKKWKTKFFEKMASLMPSKIAKNGQNRVFWLLRAPISTNKKRRPLCLLEFFNFLIWAIFDPTSPKNVPGVGLGRGNPSKVCLRVTHGDIMVNLTQNSSNQLPFYVLEFQGPLGLRNLLHNFITKAGKTSRG